MASLAPKPKKYQNCRLVYIITMYRGNFGNKLRRKKNEVFFSLQNQKWRPKNRPLNGLRLRLFIFAKIMAYKIPTSWRWNEVDIFKDKDFMVILKMVIWPQCQNFRPLYLGPQRSQKVVILDFGVSYIGEQMWQISSKSVGVRSRGWLSWHGMTQIHPKNWLDSN